MPALETTTVGQRGGRRRQTKFTLSFQEGTNLGACLLLDPYLCWHRWWCPRHIHGNQQHLWCRVHDAVLPPGHEPRDDGLCRRGPLRCRTNAICTFFTPIAFSVMICDHLCLCCLRLNSLNIHVKPLPTCTYIGSFWKVVA